MPAEQLSFEVGGVKLQTVAFAIAGANSDAKVAAADIQTKMRDAVDEEIDDRERKELNQQFEALLNEFRVLELALLEYNYYR